MLQKPSIVMVKSFIHDSMTEYRLMKIGLKQKVANNSKVANNFINFKNRGDLWEASAGVFEIFFSVDRFFRSNVSNKKRKTGLKQMVSSLIMNFSNLVLKIINYFVMDPLDPFIVPFTGSRFIT